MLKACCSGRKTTLSTPQLCVVRYGQWACQAPLGEPLLPLIVQRFATLLLARPCDAGAASGSTPPSCVGQRLVTVKMAVQLMTRVQDRIDAELVFLRESQDRDEDHFLRHRIGFYEACRLWIGDRKLLEDHVYVPSLGAAYDPERLILIFNNDQDRLWWDLFDAETDDQERERVLRLLRDERDRLLPKWISAAPRRPSDPATEAVILQRFRAQDDPVRIGSASTPGHRNCRRRGTAPFHANPCSEMVLREPILLQV